MDAYKFLDNELSPNGNFAAIRKAQEKASKETAIPFLFVASRKSTHRHRPTCLSDMTMLHEYPDLELDNSLNVPKYQALSDVLTSFCKFSNLSPHLTEIPPLLSYIETLPCLPPPLLARDYGQDAS
jgi:hypothetical protein